MLQVVEIKLQAHQEEEKGNAQLCERQNLLFRRAAAGDEEGEHKSGNNVADDDGLLQELGQEGEYYDD